MEYEFARQLVQKYLDNTLTSREREQLLQMTEGKKHPELMVLLQEMLAEEEVANVPVDEQRMKDTLARVLDVDKPRPAIRIPKITWLRYAAAVVLVAGLSIFLWLNNRDHIEPSVLQRHDSNQIVEDVLPGGPKAMLTLSDGRTILLDSAADGELAAQQGMQILKKDGEIIYSPLSTDEGTMVYNTLQTPKGGIYQLTLPDGTKVLLNAASSIRYPVMFSGKERLVEMKGEAYFEVAHNAEMPFKVKINDMNSVEVLGTHFNIKAYADESTIRTTLLEGAVRIMSNNRKGILKPGQQAQASGKQLSVNDIGQLGIEEAMAWKEGLFNFQDADLQEIMRQLGRWYDIEIIYEQGIPQLEFIGQIERSLPLSEVLKGLKMSGVNFRLEKGRRLVVFP